MRSKEQELFNKGLKYFNNKNYYDAHEEWEELWINHKLKDALLIQGLIQLAVGYFHIKNSNIKGSLSLFNKSIPKFEKYFINEREIDVAYILKQVSLTIKDLNSIPHTSKFDWSLAPRFKLK